MIIELRQMADTSEYVFWDGSEFVGKSIVIITKGELHEYMNKHPFPETLTYNAANLELELCDYKRETYIVTCNFEQAAWITDMMNTFFK